MEKNISSMTAYARNSDQSEWGSAIWEIRTVNHRSLDCSIKVPEVFRQLETEIRERLRKKIHRGRVDCFLQYKSGETSGLISTLNVPLLKELGNLMSQVNAFIPEVKSANALQVLSWPGILQTEEQNLEMANTAVLQLFDKTLADLLMAREREGKALGEFITKNLTNILEITAKVRPKISEVLSNQRAKMLARLSELTAELDQTRLEQEMVYYAQKIDVTEELDRLETHVKETLRVLEQGGNVGKKLDFLMQEFNREANTLASKSADKDVTAMAVELKVLIEQMREQLQNIE